MEIDLFTSSLAALINVAQAALLTGAPSKRWGNSHPQIVPYRPFEASDGAFIVAAGTDRHFARLCRIVGRPEWAEETAFRTNAARLENREALEGELERIFRARPRAEWVAACREAGIPAGPVRGPLEALRSGVAESLNAIVAASGVSFVASPIRVDGSDAPLRFPPQLDQDGSAIRSEFNLPG